MKVKVRSSLVEPVLKAVASSFTHSLRVWPVKNRAFSSSTRPQPWQFDGMAVAPVMLTAELTSVALSRAAEGVKALARLSLPGRVPAVRVVLADQGRQARGARRRHAGARRWTSVPQLLVVMLMSLLAETMLDPGTVTSGLMRPSSVGPQLLNEAMELALVLRRVAPTDDAVLGRRRAAHRPRARARSCRRRRRSGSPCGST